MIKNHLWLLLGCYCNWIICSLLLSRYTSWSQPHSSQWYLAAVGVCLMRITKASQHFGYMILLHQHGPLQLQHNVLNQIIVVDNPKVCFPIPFAHWALQTHYHGQDFHYELNGCCGGWIGVTFIMKGGFHLIQWGYQPLLICQWRTVWDGSWDEYCVEVGTKTGSKEMSPMPLYKWTIILDQLIEW